MTLELFGEYEVHVSLVSVEIQSFLDITAIRGRDADEFFEIFQMESKEDK